MARHAALLGALVALASPGVAAGTPASSAECVPLATMAIDTTAHASCIDVTVRLADAPVVGQQTRVDVQVATTSAGSPVSVDVRLPAGLEWVQSPAGLTASTRASAAPADRGRVHVAAGVGHAAKDRPLRLSGVVRAVSAGSAEIRVSAAAGADTAADSAFLTIGDRASSFGISVGDTSAAVAASGRATRANAQLTHKPAAPSSAAAGSVCATGAWGYIDHLGAAKVSPNAQVQLFDHDTKGPHELLASGLTDADGRFRLCFDNVDEAGGGQEVYARFATENEHWIIRNGRTRKSYGFATPVAPTAVDGALVDFGATQPGDPAMMRGVEAFDVMNAAWNWTPGTCWDAMDSVCRRGQINWAPDSTDGTYYSLQDNSVHLAAADPDSNILVLHEFGHAIMDDVYDDDFPPVTNCSPHYIHKSSSVGCAWTEGFATWYGVAILGDPTFRWPDGRTRDLEGPTWGTPDWDNGHTVEGRVLGAMIDLYDTANEPGDTCSENPAGPLWTTFVTHVSDTFAQFWAHRAADGFDVGPAALDCLYHNTIDY